MVSCLVLSFKTELKPPTFAFRQLFLHITRHPGAQHRHLHADVSEDFLHWPHDPELLGNSSLRGLWSRFHGRLEAALGSLQGAPLGQRLFPGPECRAHPDGESGREVGLSSPANTLLLTWEDRSFPQHSVFQHQQSHCPASNHPQQIISAQSRFEESSSDPPGCSQELLSSSFPRAALELGYGALSPQKRQQGGSLGKQKKAQTKV